MADFVGTQGTVYLISNTPTNESGFRQGPSPQTAGRVVVDSRGWVHVKVDDGKVVSYPPTSVESVAWADGPELPGLV